MDQLNYVELRGRVGMVRTSAVGDRSVCHFSVATNTIYHNSDNALVEEVTWHNCTIWSGKRLGDLTFIKAGIPIEVKGRLRSGKYTSADGIERVSTEIIASQVTALPENEPLKPSMV